jgi:hypothetical protein
VIGSDPQGFHENSPGCGCGWGGVVLWFVSFRSKWKTFPLLAARGEPWRGFPLQRLDGEGE